jgi:uncharacterized protein YeeX (DUF496 family)
MLRDIKSQDDIKQVIKTMRADTSKTIDDAFSQ